MIVQNFLPQGGPKGNQIALRGAALIKRLSKGTKNRYFLDPTNLTNYVMVKNIVFLAIYLKVGLAYAEKAHKAR